MKYAPTVMPILRAQRGFLMEHWGNAEIIGEKDGNVIQIVTAIDIEMERRVAEELKKSYPDVTFVGEEGGGERHGMFWLMDPIDGTQHYVRGLPFCTSMLALIDKGEVVFSAIYDFINDRMYYAERGEGAFCNDKKLSVSNRALRDAYISWETHLDRPENRAVLDRIWEMTNVVKTLCAGWEFIMVAEGKMDARLGFDPHGKDYDFAPGSLIVREAGGVVTNVGSTSYDYRDVNHIVANPAIYKELTEGENALFPIRK